MTETTEERVARLEQRLQDGFRKIAEATSQGTAVDRVEKWEAVWVDVLREYEALNDEIAAHEAERVQTELPMAVRRNDRFMKGVA